MGFLKWVFPLLLCPLPAPANLGRVTADFLMYWRHSLGWCRVEMLDQVAVSWQLVPKKANDNSTPSYSLHN